MKTKVFLMFVFFLLTNMFFVGCIEDPVLDPKPELKSYFTVSVSPTESVAYNTTIDIKVVAENLTFWTLNGKIINSNLLTIPELVKDTTLKFYALGNDDQKWDTTIVVKVSAPPVYTLTKLDTLLSVFCNKGWRSVETKDYYLDGTLLFACVFTDKYTKELWYFYSDGSRKIDRSANNEISTLLGPGSWGFSDDCNYIWFGDKTNTFEFMLTEDTFIKISLNYKIGTTGEKIPIKSHQIYKL